VPITWIEDHRVTGYGQRLKRKKDEGKGKKGRKAFSITSRSRSEVTKYVSIPLGNEYSITSLARRILVGAAARKKKKKGKSFLRVSQTYFCTSELDREVIENSFLAQSTEVGRSGKEEKKTRMIFDHVIGTSLPASYHTKSSAYSSLVWFQVNAGRKKRKDGRKRRRGKTSVVIP